jgi:Coenzyme PQQ synthesis protein D (PqqD)
VVDDNLHLRTMVNADGAAILDTKRGKISTLNTTGAYVWQALERGEDVETIAVNLARETGEQLDRLKRDVLEFIDDLKKQHLCRADVEER